MNLKIDGVIKSPNLSFVPLISINIKAVKGRIQFLKWNNMIVIFNQHPMRCATGRHKRNITCWIHTRSQAVSQVYILVPFSKLQAWYFALKIYFGPYCLKLLINKKVAKLEAPILEINAKVPCITISNYWIPAGMTEYGAKITKAGSFTFYKAVTNNSLENT